MSDLEQKARELLADEYEADGCIKLARMIRSGDVTDPDFGSVKIMRAMRAIIAALTPPEQFPEGWHLSERATCYVLSEGNNIVGNFVGPDAEQNAARVARMLAARPEVK